MNPRRRPLIIEDTDVEVVEKAARSLRDGQIVVFPTDTVYGVGASVDRPDAVARLYDVKGRPLDRPIPVLVSSFAQVRRLTLDFDPRIERLLHHFWPGPLTVAVPAAGWLPREVVRDTGRVGVRMPDLPLALAIIDAAGGAVATTSANRSGEMEARTAVQAEDAIGATVDVIVDGGRTPGGVPSTVVVVDGDRLLITRRGPIHPEALARLAPDFIVES